jgi:hypothetical protein
MSREMIAPILWAIFGDARQFFSKCAMTKDFEDIDNLPQSHLQAVHCILAFLASKIKLQLMDVPPELLSKTPTDRGFLEQGV